MSLRHAWETKSTVVPDVRSPERKRHRGWINLSSQIVEINSTVGVNAAKQQGRYENTDPLPLVKLTDPCSSPSLNKSSSEQNQD